MSYSYLVSLDFLEDINSESEGNSSESKHEIKDELISEDSEIINACSSDSREAHAISCESQSFAENVQLIQFNTDKEQSIDTDPPIQVAESADVCEVHVEDINAKHSQVLEEVTAPQKSSVEEGTLCGTENKLSSGKWFTKYIL